MCLLIPKLPIENTIEVTLSGTPVVIWRHCNKIKRALTRLKILLHQLVGKLVGLLQNMLIDYGQGGTKFTCKPKFTKSIKLLKYWIWIFSLFIEASITNKPISTVKSIAKLKKIAAKQYYKTSTMQYIILLTYEIENIQLEYNFLRKFNIEEQQFPSQTNRSFTVFNQQLIAKQNNILRT